MVRTKFVCKNCGFTIIGNLKKGDNLICPNCKTIMDKKLLSVEGDDQTRSRMKVIAASLLAVSIFITISLFIIIPAYNGDLHFLVVLSGSMEPNIHPGDIVASSKVDFRDVKVGDTITFKYKDNKNYVTHRVIEIIEENNRVFFRTKGDANEDPDNRLVREDELIGKVILVIPYLGYLPAFARTTMGWLVLIVIPGILVIVNELLNIRKELVRRRVSR